MAKKHLLVALVAASVLAGGGIALAAPHGPVDRGDLPPCMGNWDYPDGPGGYGYHHRGFRGPRHWDDGYGPHHWSDRGACWQYGRLTAEKREALDKIIDEFEPRLNELQLQFRVKRMELGALSRNANATPADIHKATEELSQIGAEINKAHQAMRERIDKEVGPVPYDAPRRNGNRNAK